MTTYGYARVSTNGQNLDEQIEQLRAHDIEPTNIFSEKFTGTKTNRPQFNELLSTIKSGDTLVVTKLDRLARNTQEALKVINKLLDDDITINVLNLGILENSTTGKLVTTVLLAISQMERDLIVERTQAGKEYAKKHNKNFKEGRPKRVITKYYMNIYKYLKNGHSYSETAEYFGVARTTVYNIKRQIEQDK